MILTGDGESVTGLWIDRQKYRGAARAGLEETPDLPAFKAPANGLTGTLRGRSRRPPKCR